MPNENDDIEPSSQQDLQPHAANAAQGPVGPEPPEAQAPPSAPDSGPSHGVGQPGPPSPPPTACPKCEAEVSAGAGRCPRCGVFQRANDWSVIHAGRARLTPADLATRDALMAELFRERGGRASLDVVSQLRVEDYATAQIQLGKVTRRLEALGAVSPAGNERKSLVST